MERKAIDCFGGEPGGVVDSINALMGSCSSLPGAEKVSKSKPDGCAAYGLILLTCSNKDKISKNKNDNI